MNFWIDQQNGIARQIEVDRLQYFTAARSQRGFIDNEKRTIAAEPEGVVEQLFGAQL
jgi:hypothetical protein